MTAAIEQNPRPIPLPASQAREKTSSVLTIIVLIIIALLGLMNLPTPFTGDQALFTVGAKELSHGAVLYRDFWDLKQPGIYWFYLAAGTFFDFSEIGVHSLELIYFITFAVVTTRITRRYYRTSWGPIVAAMLTTGVYFIVAGDWHLTQLEGLVGPPIFFCLWWILPPGDEQKNWPLRATLAGAMAGVVVLFKLVLVLIPATFFLIAIVEVIRRREFRSVISIVIFALIGFVAVIAGPLIYLASQGQLSEMYRTFFVYPPRIVRETSSHGVRILVSGLKWFAIAAGPMIPFAVIAVISRFREGNDRFTRGLIAWAGVAFALVLVQRMWWEYHFLLLFMPIGFLATAGIERIVPALRTSRSVAFLAAMVLVFPYTYRLTGKAMHMSFANLVTPERRRLSHESSHYPNYDRAFDATQFLTRSDAAAGPIYVIGDPLWYYLSGRAQAISINGWSPEWLLAEQWTQIADELRVAQPPYIFVDAENIEFLLDRGPAVKAVLDQDYTEYWRTPDGIWYRLQSLSIRPLPATQPKKSAAPAPAEKKPKIRIMTKADLLSPVISVTFPISCWLTTR